MVKRIGGDEKGSEQRIGQSSARYQEDHRRYREEGAGEIAKDP